jgi:cyanophycin synthetase
VVRTLRPSSFYPMRGTACWFILRAMDRDDTVDLIEIRDLDGPNLFAPRPVLKLEVSVSADERVNARLRDEVQAALGVVLEDDILDALKATIGALHERAGLPLRGLGSRPLDTPGHVAIYYDWQHRSTAMRIAELAFDGLARGISSDVATDLKTHLERDGRESDGPLWVRDEQRGIPSVGITGTNGKTTTTRLVAHLLRSAGRHVGWSSSSGVYIDGEQVMEGDYTGPAGARRVMSDDTVEVAVLETARGGILLRGLAYESNDVGVFLNVTADHLGMHGVSRIETLAEVKSIVVRVTRPDGLVVLNADDPLVMAQREHVRAPVLFFSQDPRNPTVLEHVAGGGRALVRDQDVIEHVQGAQREVIASLAEVPMTFGGAARHMVENALAGIGAALGLGLAREQIVTGLQSFRSDLSSNTGRLNVFRLDGKIIVVDYAHNESGLEALLAFSRSLMQGEGHLAAIIGTAGDRQDDVLRGLGEIASRDADRIFVKENPRYLRGRPAGEQCAIIRDSVVAAGASERIGGLFGGEHAALVAALEETHEGDAIAVMCVEEQLAVFRELRDRGAEEWA